MSSPTATPPPVLMAYGATGGGGRPALPAEIWRSTWRRAVRGCLHGAVLVELPSTTIVGLSHSAQELLGVTADTGVRLDDLAERRDGTSELQLGEVLGRGFADAVQGRHVLRRPDGRTVDVWCSTRAIRSPAGRDLALVGLQAVGSPMGLSAVASTPLVQPASGIAVGMDQPLALVDLDEAWSVRTVRLGPVPEPDRLPIELGGHALDLFRPQDRTRLLCALALATTGVRASVNGGVCLEAEPSSRPLAAVVTFGDTHDPPRFTLELHRLDDLALPASGGAGPSGRVVELELRLRRIAAEVEAANLLAPYGTATPFEVPGLEGLSERQTEIVFRLVRGERVPTIAREMYLSQSTVRNHLTAVFRKLKVHSQEELLAALRERTRWPHPSD